jgi:protease I
MKTFDLQNKSVAILAADGFEQSELTSPRDALTEAGADVAIISLESGKITGYDSSKQQPNETVNVDLTIDNASADDFNALLLPGGLKSPDSLRSDDRVQSFVRKFFADGKPVAAICHGPWILVDAGVLDGRKVTSYHSIKQDLINAGARWTDEPVVVDQGLVTSRNPGDLDRFNAKLLEEVHEGKHADQTV